MSQPTQPGQSNLNALEVDDLDPQEVDLTKVWYDKYKDLPYKDLAARMVELKKLSDEAERAKKAATAEFDVIRLRVVPERFAKDEMTSLRITGIGRLGISADAYCTVIPGRKDDLLALLKTDPENALLVKEDINPSTLKSLVKGLVAEEANNTDEANFEEFADEGAEPTELEKILKYVNYTPFMRASVTKG